MVFVRTALLLLPIVACSYKDDKVLRQYDVALEPVRALVLEVTRQQPRLSERRSAERLRAEVETHFLPLVLRLNNTLAGIEATAEPIRPLHEELVSLWREYYELFEEFAEDLSGPSLAEKRARLGEGLERFAGRYQAWTLDFQALDEQVTGRGG